MRRLPDGFRYTMEFLIASGCVAFKEQGYAMVSLSGVDRVKRLYMVFPELGSAYLDGLGPAKLLAQAKT
ncbi:hypothetical protein H4N58_03205 [Mumia sp. ZJ1417]|nr:hypothetical protein H4N58_03205 [Mumia sp. ZJ1417]